MIAQKKSDAQPSFVCANCGKMKTREGFVFRWLAPLLVIFFAYPFGAKICEECASIFNAIGVFLFLLAIPALLVLVLLLI